MTLLVALVGCAARERPAVVGSTATQPSSALPDATPPGTSAEHGELQALLLFLADRRVIEPTVVGQALEASPPIRRQLALALGRIGDLAGRPALVTLLSDPETAVRRAAAFALGRLPADAEIDRRLRVAAADDDPVTGTRAVTALARRGVGLDTVLTALFHLPREALLSRLLPALFRFDHDGVVRWAEIGLEQDDPGLRRWAAYGLSREPRAVGVDALRGLLDDDDPWIVGWAARALGRIGDRSDLARFAAPLARGEAGPVIQALRAARALIDRGAAAPPESWRPRLLTWLDDERIGVRLAALDLAAVFLLDDALGALLAQRVRDLDRPLHERSRALLALAEGEDPRAESLVLDAARDGAPTLRARAAEAAGRLGIEALLHDLLDDQAVPVRVAALTALLGMHRPEAAASHAEAALADDDAGMRAVALEWLAEHPLVSVERLIAATAMPDRLALARGAAVPALEARATAKRAERDAAAARLADLATSGPYAQRRAAGQALAALRMPEPRLGPAVSRPLAVYRDVVAQTNAPRYVEMVTTAGTLRLRLRLECPAAPMTCLDFLRLSAQGYYDGLAWHRVIPDFVVQAGDPRGDGRGGPGGALRDEPNPMPYRRGTVGMARGAPDTASGQFFIALSAQPHLDGDYTAFGQVVAGDSILDRIVQGDRIERVSEILGPVQP